MKINIQLKKIKFQNLFKVRTLPNKKNDAMTAPSIVW